MSRGIFKARRKFADDRRAVDGLVPEPRQVNWQVLYPVIIATFGFVFVQAVRGKIPWLVAVAFAINLVANLGCTPTHFSGARSPITMPANTTRLRARGIHDQPEAGAEQPDDHPQGNQFEHARKGSAEYRQLGACPISSRSRFWGMRAAFEFG
jgi:hypothetical protein